MGMKVVESEFATVEDGYEEKEIKVKRGGFWERIFEKDPTLHIWDDYKTVIVSVPKRSPAMFLIGDVFLAHPKIMIGLKNLSEDFINLSKTTEATTSSIYNFSMTMEDLNLSRNSIFRENL